MQEKTIKALIKKILPSCVWSKLRYMKELCIKERSQAYNQFLVMTQPKRHKKALENLKVKIQNGKKIKVAFFVLNSSEWKLDRVFQFMLTDDRFEPVVVVCPCTAYGRERMLENMKQAFIFFTDKGYKTIYTYNELSGEWLAVKNTIQPDIVFFTNVWKASENEEYYINNYLDTLTCYVPYGFIVSHLYQVQYNQLFHNLLWKAFYETAIHKEIAKKYASNKGANVIVSGYPGIDQFLDKKYSSKDCWKIKDRKIKRIIWAPHHTIYPTTFANENICYSNFLDYSLFFQELLEKYKNKIQIAFKPHPELKSKLYLHPDWGKEKTDTYYDFWQTHEFGQLEESWYIDLFLNSDALIHDSASFLAEYFYTGKPELFIKKSNKVYSEFNKFGQLIMDNIYCANNEKDITGFIETVVIQESDHMKKQRSDIIEEYISSLDGKSSSQNIMENLIQFLQL